MAAIVTCPDEYELLPVATGEPAGEAIEGHLDTCPACRGRMERLRAELSELRREFGGAVPSEPIGLGPAAGPEGEPSGG
jgi:hypothetical protein